MRSREAHFLASETEHLLEQVISAEINPSGYVFAVFLPSDVRNDFGSGKKAKVDPLGSKFLSRGIHVFASMNMVELLRYNLNDDSSVVYLIDYKNIVAVTTSSAEPIALGRCTKEAQSLIQNRMDFLNHKSQTDKAR